MAIKIIRHGRVIEDVEYYILYEWVEEPDVGFRFPCNEHGEIDFRGMSKKSMTDYEKCDSEEYEVVYRGMQRKVTERTEPTVGRCGCGEEVALVGSSNQCMSCGRWYSSMGQYLKHTL